MNDGDMAKAISVINEAVNNEATSRSGDAWFTRGEIYEKLGDKDSVAFEESKKSYLKVVEVDPKYDKGLINAKLGRLAEISFNKGVNAYNAGDFAGAEKNYGFVLSLYQLNDGKQFAGNDAFKKIAASAQRFEAYSAYNQKKDDRAIAMLEKVKANPDAREVYTYIALIDAYADKKDNAAVERTIAEAKAAYPKDEQINARELNYYANSDKADVFLKKLEESVQKDPDNAVLQFNLAVAYSNAANPRNAENQPVAKPANSKELEAKAETAYKMAIDAEPGNADYVYNLGALYFNNAADLTNRMNEITGTSEAENRKYDELKGLRTREFSKALPYFQKSYDLLNPKVGNMNQDQFNTYRGTLIALQTIYEDLGQKEKSTTIGAKIAEITK
ncbi:MAG: hypothetical protein QM743_12915 [Chitinophagaceae bacterium]